VPPAPPTTLLVPPPATGADVPPPGPDAPSPPPAQETLPLPAPEGVGAAPASNTANTAGTPVLAVAQYNPRTGEYAAPDGQLLRQSDLVPSLAPRTWQDLLLTPPPV
jgi:hypothetical protein